MTARRGLALVAALLGIAALLALLSGWRPLSHSSAVPQPAQTPLGDTIRLDAKAQANAGIQVVSATEREHRDRLQAPGVLALDETRTARIGAAIEGKVLTVAADVGDRVSAGQVLALLHSPLIHDAWAAYRKGVAARRQADNELIYARAAHARAQRLYADRAISLQELQRALADRQTAEQNLDMARTEVRRSEETLQHLGITSGDDPSAESGEQIPVRSPLQGAVLEKDVTPGSAVTPGAELFVVSDLTTLWALAEVDETKLARVHVGQPVELSVAAYPGESFGGTIIFIADALDAKTRRITVRCRIPNDDGRLKPQMFATVALGESAPRRMIVVPAAAVQQIGDQTVVFIAADDGSFVRRAVHIGNEIDHSIEIVDGVRAGERVAGTGSFLLKSELLKSAMEE